MSKRDLEIYDTKKGEYFNPAERHKKAKQKALEEKAQRKTKGAQNYNEEQKNLGRQINNAESEKEASRLERKRQALMDLHKRKI